MHACLTLRPLPPTARRRARRPAARLLRYVVRRQRWPDPLERRVGVPATAVLSGSTLGLLDEGYMSLTAPANTPDPAATPLTLRFGERRSRHIAGAGVHRQQSLAGGRDLRCRRTRRSTEIDMRVRIDRFTSVRAVAETRDGKFKCAAPGERRFFFVFFFLFLYYLVRLRIANAFINLTISYVFLPTFCISKTFVGIKALF